MSEISKTYQPAEVENKWYAYWMHHAHFKATPDPNKKPYTIVIPPPNVTGVLHMGHMLNNSIQDILVRRKRMQGYAACWVPGTDHASIATEAKVVAKLKEQGIEKHQLTRVEFLKHVWQWKEKYGGIILEQLKKLGAGCDWDRTRFTMEPALSEAVLDVFIKLYKKGYIYRGARMVNWDPQGKTALSDEEVIYKESQSKLHFIKYYAADSNKPLHERDYFTIATTRPETIMGDVAICVHPNDPRYNQIIGKKYLVPIIHRPIPVITDTAVDMEFGTGSLKVTPAHDLVDYQIGLKYNLEVIDVLTEEGKISPTGQIFVGDDRFIARKKIVKQLQEEGYLIESKDITNKVGTSERTGAIIEPRISTQWFCSMKEMAARALEVVENDTVKLYPKEKFINTYRNWMTQVQDWCISRQLWWGHQIPAWYDSKGRIAVGKNHQEALDDFKQTYGTLPEDNKLIQDEDVLDTWFSSWLWPITVFDGLKDPDNPDFTYFYPTDDLVTAPEILFFWVARMIMAGQEFTGKVPFKNVYLTGIVRDKQGRKMSKSLGNSPDPETLIQQYSADGMRVGMLLSSQAGNDIMFDEKLCEQGRNFANKIWNAYRLLKSWNIDAALPEQHSQASIWFEHTLYKSSAEIEENFEKFRISDALMLTYKLVWDDYCAWYLEWIKPEFGKPISKPDFERAISFFEILLKRLHPFMPFITEEIWQDIQPRTPAQALIVSSYPAEKPFEDTIVQGGKTAFDIVSAVRNFRSSHGLSPKDGLQLHVKNVRDIDMVSLIKPYLGAIHKLANISSIAIENCTTDAYVFVVNNIECAIPTAGKIDVSAQKVELTKELEYLEGFLKSVDAKLSNEKFVNNAKPEIIENERKKKADAMAKIERIKAQLM